MCSLMQVRPPMPPRFFYVIDVSYVAVNSGALPVICQAIKDSLDRLPGGERTQVGFLTFDSTLHFYNLASRLSQPQMMVGGLSALPSVGGACPSAAQASPHPRCTGLQSQLSAMQHNTVKLHAGG